MIDLTVGIPVYNGAELIGEALDCLCQQSYTDLRILVSDNASSDATADIVLERARADSRIELIKQTTNLGPVGNFRFLVEAATTPFFAWRAHDDISAPDFFEVLRTGLITAPDVALCAPCTLTRRAKGDRRRPFPKLRPGSAALNSRQVNTLEAGWFYGLHRTQIAKEGVTIAHEHYAHVWGWDYIVLLNALLHGGITGTNDTNFIHRLSGSSSGRYEYDKQHLRQIFRDFIGVGDRLALTRGLGGIDRQLFRLNLTRLAGRRVTRWQRLV